MNPDSYNYFFLTLGILTAPIWIPISAIMITLGIISGKFK